jgi:hypothetical protein
MFVSARMQSVCKIVVVQMKNSLARCLHIPVGLICWHVVLRTEPKIRMSLVLDVSNVLCAVVVCPWHLTRHCCPITCRSICATINEDCLNLTYLILQSFGLKWNISCHLQFCCSVCTSPKTTVSHGLLQTSKFLVRRSFNTHPPLPLLL